MAASFGLAHSEEEQQGRKHTRQRADDERGFPGRDHAENWQGDDVVSTELCDDVTADQQCDTRAEETRTGHHCERQRKACRTEIVGQHGKPGRRESRFTDTDHRACDE